MMENSDKCGSGGSTLDKSTVVALVRVAVFLVIVQLLFGALGKPRARQAPTGMESGAFRVVRMGNAKTKDGTDVFFTELLSSKGLRIHKIWIPFKSPELAEKELEEVIKLSIKVIRSKPEVDEQGKILGRRVLVLFPSSGSDKPRTRLCWTTGSLFQEITSESTDDVLALEKIVAVSPVKPAN